MPVLIVAGVSGSGKTTVGRSVAQHCAAQFLDGDDLHPPENVAKMHAGIPLTDQDREPWLDAIRSRVVEAIANRQRVVIAASCLERVHRKHVVGDSTPADVRIAFLDVSYELAFERAHHRHHAFFPETLVRSQFAALELAGPDEPHVRHFDGAKSVAELVDEIARYFVDIYGMLGS